MGPNSNGGRHYNNSSSEQRRGKDEQGSGSQMVSPTEATGLRAKDVRGHGAFLEPRHVVFT